MPVKRHSCDSKPNFIKTYSCLTRKAANQLPDVMTLPSKLLLTIVMLTITAPCVKSQVFLSEDLESTGSPGLPAGWASTPASVWVTGAPDVIMPNALASLGISLNRAAHLKAVGIDGFQAAADGAILSSPGFSLPMSAVQAVLRFDLAYFGMQSNANPPQTEGLVFMVSTDGGATWTDVSFVAPVGQWESQSIPMSAYAGQGNLKFGFRYNNQGGALIGVTFDNFRLIDGADGRVLRAFAGDHPDPSTGTGYQLSGSAATLTGSIQNTGTTTISSYYIRYAANGGPVQSSSLIPVPLAPMDTASFPPGLTVMIPADTSYAINAWIEVTGDVDHLNDTITAHAVGVPYIPLKRLVFEEGTGTWCGWCPRGAVFMDHFAATHPNGVAAQIAVHNSDPMTIPAYDTFMAGYAGGYPNIVIDRTVQRDPRTIDADFAQGHDNFGFADFTIGSPVISGSAVSIPVSIKPVVTITNPRLALVITESNVTATDTNATWAQTNYYSGGSEVMGGWEQEAGHVQGVYYHFVARGITPAPGGGAGNLPATLVAGNTYTDTLQTSLNTGLWKLNDLQYIALLINGNNGAVMNSAFTALPALIPALSNTTGMSDADDDRMQPVIYPNPATGNSYLAVTVKGASKAVVTLSDIMGRKLFNTIHQLYAGANTIAMKTGDLAPGSYIVHFSTGKQSVSLKLQVVE